MIDIVSIKEAVKKGEMKAYVKDGVIYLRNDIGEVVIIGKVDKPKCYMTMRYETVDPARWGVVADGVGQMTVGYNI